LGRNDWSHYPRLQWILEELEKERFGFYHLILENVTGVIETTGELSYLIIDTFYNKKIHQVSLNDLGMDAVYIAENEDVDIKLFNFKYRENFNPDKTKSEADISRSTKFLEYVVQGKIIEETQPVHNVINMIIGHQQSNKICNLTLYFVSNENAGFASDSNDYIKILEDSYGMKIINISLDDIIGFFNEKQRGRKSKFMITPDACLSFQSDQRTTQKSYILKLSLLDLVRITCNNESLATNYSIEEDAEIAGATLDYSLLYDNVRGFLGNTKYNKNILKTLSSSHELFFMFNNGITITAEKIECESKNSGAKYLFTIEDFQVVNGGQTVRSVFNFLNENENEEDDTIIAHLRESFVLLRIFKITENDPLQNDIAEYTNSQNAISDVDLKSIDRIQIQIENFLAEFGILYARKSGDLGSDDKDYSFRISMEKLAQILYSAIGYPDRASSQKRRLFQDYYDEIFKADSFSLEISKKMIDLFNFVSNVYANTGHKSSDQKIFYVIFLVLHSGLNADQAIDTLEALLRSYESDVADSRKLIQKGFKDYVISELNMQ